MIPAPSIRRGISAVWSGRKRLRSAAAIVPLAAAALLTGSAAGASGGATVTLKDIAFNKEKVTIHKGQTVTWKWKDPLTNHNIHSRGTPRFKGASSRQTGTYRVTFKKKGTYRYECTIHPGMYGTVVVK